MMNENGRLKVLELKDQNNIVDVSRLMITFKPMRGYVVRRWEIEKVEGLV
jgi:hypothetical protein